MNRTLLRTACAGWAVLLIAAPGHPEGAPPVWGADGMVVSSTVQSSNAGIEMFALGGNAFDAAAATGFALAVTHPVATPIGGGGFMVAWTAEGDAVSLDFREIAPAAASRDMFLDSDGNVVPGASLDSALASGVPGGVHGLLRIWEERGSGEVSRSQLLAPAIKLASEGFPLGPAEAESLNLNREKFARHAAARAIFVREDGRPWRPGDRLVQRELAQVLVRISENGGDGFYRGETARGIADYMKATGGLITEEDLANYESKWREPVKGSFKQFEIISMGPPSSGGFLVIQILNMIEPFDLARLGLRSSGYVHLLTEAERLAYADRAAHLGDPDFWDVPVDGLLAKDYARARFADFDPDKARSSRTVAEGDPVPYEPPQTAHYSVADRFGNAVAVTVTINATYGSGHVVPGTGILLNNEMDDFSAKPGVPNLYGVIGGEANAIAPGKRMLSSMSPTVVLENGKPRLILGSPGGSSIPTTVLQVFLNSVVFGLDVSDAVAEPRHHSQWLPDAVMVEPRALPMDVRDALVARGHSVTEYPGGRIGQANCIEFREDGLFGGADPRGDNAAVGYTRN